jgi:hypothetical protein
MTKIAGGLIPLALGDVGYLGQRGTHRALAREGSLLDDRCGRRAAHSTGNQSSADLGQGAHAHVADQGRVRVLSEEIPAHLRHAAFVGGDEGQTNRFAPEGHWDASRRRNGDSRGHARNNFARNASLSQNQRLFTPTREDERIASLQANHALAFAGQAQQEGIDLVLGHGVPAGLLANIVKLDMVREIERDGWDGSRS